MPSGGSHPYRLIDIDGHKPRHARLVHRYTHELIRHLHRTLVVADEDELDSPRHVANDLAESAHIGIVERRVDLIEHAERCGVELEERKHQRHSGERFLATRQQVNGAVALARGARHYGDSGRQQIIPGQVEVGLAAAKEFREQVLEALVHLVVGFLESISRFAVDLADRILERRQC